MDSAADRCAVCMVSFGDDVADGDEVAENCAALCLRVCKHAYHATCVDRWFANCDRHRVARTCPLCVRVVRPATVDVTQVIANFWEDMELAIHIVRLRLLEKNRRPFNVIPVRNNVVALPPVPPLEKTLKELAVYHRAQLRLTLTLWRICDNTATLRTWLMLQRDRRNAMSRETRRTIHFFAGGADTI